MTGMAVSGPGRYRSAPANEGVLAAEVRTGVRTRRARLSFIWPSND
jgi:hypothetical protein